MSKKYKANTDIFDQNKVFITQLESGTIPVIELDTVHGGWIKVKPFHLQGEKIREAHKLQTLVSITFLSAHPTVVLVAAVQGFGGHKCMQGFHLQPQMKVMLGYLVYI